MSDDDSNDWVPFELPGTLKAERHRITGYLRLMLTGPIDTIVLTFTVAEALEALEQEPPTT